MQWVSEKMQDIAGKSKAHVRVASKVTPAVKPANFRPWPYCFWSVHDKEEDWNQVWVVEKAPETLKTAFQKGKELNLASLH